MNREVKYRAKTEFTEKENKFVYGYPVKGVCATGSQWFMHVPPKDPDDNYNIYPIDPSTLGQHIGRKDNYFNEAFEGDKAILYFGLSSICGLCRELHYPFVIVYNEFYARYEFYDNASDTTYTLEQVEGFKVVGNIHEE